MAMRAREVMLALVEDERITWRKGCRRAAVSKVLRSMYHKISILCSHVNVYFE